MIKKTTEYLFGLIVSIAITLLYITVPAQPARAAGVTKTFTSGSNVILSYGGSAKPSFSAVSTSQYASCGLTTVQTIYCSGENGYGQLGDGSNTEHHSPVQFGASLGISFSAVSTSLYTSCGLTTEQTVYCSGYNGLGGLGDGSTINRYNPVQFGASLGKSFSAVSASQYTSCGLTTVQTIYCSGWNYYGQLGNNSTVEQHSPVQFGPSLGKSFSAVSASDITSCGLTTEQTIYCSGNNGSGELGDGTYTERHSPVQFGASLGKSFSAVSASYYTVCGLTTVQTIYCSGDNEDGGLGDGTVTTRRSPVQFGPSLGKSFSAVSTSDHTSCGLTTTLDIYCSGWNSNGQLGDGSKIDRYSPVQFGASLGKSFSAVSASPYTTCGLTTDQQVYCAGSNDFGGFGNGTIISTTTPVQALIL